MSHGLRDVAAAPLPPFVVIGTGGCGMLATMFFVVGSDPSLKDAGEVNTRCRLCGQFATQRVTKRSQRVNLFFVLPVASFGTRYVLECSACHGIDVLDKDQAREAGIR